MYSQIVLCLSLAVTIWISAAEKYTTKYDNIDLEEIFKSTRLMNNYLNCLKTVGPCTPDGRELKDSLPDALRNDCNRCSERQKIGADKVIRFVVENRPEDFASLETLYDPTGEYRRKYLDGDLSLAPASDEDESSGSSTSEKATTAEHE
ncbi:ejaculatory bulb-specific protein 3-like [Toxorhynchites rutilus septentrionalis]|uniref:ejaculatory bulb-specific protein 3-like n=1 Tax=Toxorhynchites rutilus septentrionalis TaxID=329112 RepID=UPI00247A81D3|nr:ejaculatory bulb-specific protein 3-like [Toxorhynchites rutilus septentrionalis]